MPPIFEALNKGGLIRETPVQLITKDGSLKNILVDSNVRYKDEE